jgi:beta-glucanase (GH16 family)
MTMKLDRRILITAIACSAGVCLSGALQAQVPNLPGWDLVMNDEFDGGSLNTSLWTALDRKDSFNNEKQYYHPNQVTVSGGNLELTAIDVPRSGKAYQSGLITSNALYGQGRFEARIDLPTSQGMWPAFWLNANNVQWPQGGEVDIMENRGSQPNLTSSAYHWQDGTADCCGDHEYVYHEYTATEGGQPVDFHAGFHTYAVEWEENYMRFYVDDNLHFTVNSGQASLFDTPKNIILNVAVGGNFGGDPDGSTVWPQTMQVDYVRYWQKAVPLQGDVDGDGFVGISDLNIVLGEWNLGTPPAAATDVQLSDFSNFSLNGTYAQWDSGIFSPTANDFRVQANDWGGGWTNLSAPVDATGQTTLEVQLDVNPGNVADAFNIVLIDGDGTERVYHFGSLTAGDNQILTINLDDYQQDNQVGGTPGLDISNLIVVHTQGSFGNGDPGLPMDVTFDNLALTGGTTIVLEGDVDGDGYVGIADLNIILGEWNLGTPPASAAIPEPAALALFGLGGIAMLRRRR